jgi:hypothetical protein
MTEAKNTLYEQVVDYALSAADSARIRCTAHSLEGDPNTLCHRQAAYAQNRGSAPFWYHCDEHAAMWRGTGRVYKSSEPKLLFSLEANVPR